MPKEQWKIITRFPKYEVSNMGNVRKVATKRLLKPRKVTAREKYLIVSLGTGSAGKTTPKRIHRLVAIAFLKPAKGQTHVNHKKGKRLDNRASQLEWTTQAENNDHAYNVLGYKSPMLAKGQTPHNKKMTAQLLAKAVSLFNSGMKTDDIANKIKINGSNVRKALRKHFNSSLKLARNK